MLIPGVGFEPTRPDAHWVQRLNHSDILDTLLTNVRFLARWCFILFFFRRSRRRWKAVLGVRTSFELDLNKISTLKWRLALDYRLTLTIFEQLHALLPVKWLKVQYAAQALVCIKIVGISSGAIKRFQFYESPVFPILDKLDLPRCMDDVHILAWSILFEWQNTITLCAEHLLPTEACCSAARY